jgi:hypothetical protein
LLLLLLLLLLLPHNNNNNAQALIALVALAMRVGGTRGVQQLWGLVGHLVMHVRQGGELLRCWW